MFPKLSDLINHLFGCHIDLPVQTYGFFLAVAFVAAALVFRAELKRKETEGLLKPGKQTIYLDKPIRWFEAIAGIFLSAIIGWKFFGIFLYYRQFATDPQQYILSTKGSIVALFGIICISIAYHLFKHFSVKKSPHEVFEVVIHPYQYTWNIMVVGIVLVIFGSKLFDVLDNFGSFLRSPVSSLVSFQGLTFYGGFIITVLGLLVYMRILKLDWRQVIDSTAPAIMLGYAIGRLGCHFSGDGCWGIVNTLARPGWLAWLPQWLWASGFPHNVINQGIPIPDCTGTNCMVLPNPVFPTSMYESLVSFLSFCVLWLMRVRIKAPVVLFGFFMILNGSERFLIEKIRVNNKYDFLGLRLSQAEIISAFLLIAGITVILYYSKQYKARFPIDVEAD